MEKWMRNFIWSGDLNQQKLVIVAWHKLCKPYKEGGLGVRNLSDINEAGNLKNCWEIMHSDLQWASLIRSRVLRGGQPVNHHISSSVWSSAKHKFITLMENISWQIGDGQSIKFWTDPWCGEPLTTTLNIPQNLHHLFQSNIATYIKDSNWCVPQVFISAYPILQQKLSAATIPLIPKDDRMIWKPSHDGNLSFKDAYLFHTSSHSQHINWAKSIWHIMIPPSKSLLVWRLFHNKLPTDDNLILRGCYIPSVCSLCCSTQETSQHLFLDCPFAVQLWSWFVSILNLQCNVASFMDILRISDRSWSPHCKLVIKATIIHCFHTIWHCRNQKRFNDRKILISSAINMIIAGTSLSSNNSKLAASSSISEFMILKQFHVKVNPPKHHLIKEVLWSPPCFNWVKCNTDGASHGNLGLASCGGIYRNANADFLGAINLGVTSALNSELIAAMLAIEIAKLKNWRNLWLETDSMLVYLAFKSSKIVPWSLRNRWDNCLFLLSSFNFCVTHIYKEDNQCADQLANLGLTLPSYSWFNTIPPQANVEFVRNKIGFPNYRFC